MPETLFIQFAREPVAGAVKTRMQPALSPEQACALHCALVRHTARTLAEVALGRVELHVAGDTGAPLFQQCRELGLSAVLPQEGTDLGERMYRAIEHGLGRRFASVILVGSDCPQLDRGYLGDALRALDTAEVVLGPARDGGYVLLGATRVCKSWFEGIGWGGDRVFADTVARLEGAGIRWRSLPVLQDIDRPQDLPVWRAIAGEDP